MNPAGPAPHSDTREIQIEMDGERSWVYFAGSAVALEDVETPDGSMTVARLLEPVWIWTPFPRRVRFLALSVVPPERKWRARVYAIKGLRVGQPRERAHSPVRLDAKNLIELGPADLRRV